MWFSPHMHTSTSTSTDNARMQPQFSVGWFHPLVFQTWKNSSGFMTVRLLLCLALLLLCEASLAAEGGSAPSDLPDPAKGGSTPSDLPDPAKGGSTPSDLPDPAKPGHTPSDFPDPAKDITLCGRQVAGRVCDPDGLLTESALNQAQSLIDIIEKECRYYCKGEEVGYQVTVPHLTLNQERFSPVAWHKQCRISKTQTRGYLEVLPSTLSLCPPTSTFALVVRY